MPVLDETFKMRPKYNWYSKILRSIFKMRRHRLLPQNSVPDREVVARMEADKRLVIQVVYGGLGDHLVYSALPELLWKQKKIKVFVSTKSIFRNQEIWDFVWGQNPFVAATQEHGWFIHHPLEIIQQCRTINEYVMRLFELEGETTPQLYYVPSHIPELCGQAVVDCSCCSSGKANGYFESQFYTAYLNYLEQYVGKFVLLTYPRLKFRSRLEMQIQKRFSPFTHSVNSLKDLSNVLHSASRRYLLYSGSASVAAAYRLPSTVLCNRKSSLQFQYDINTYIDLLGNVQEGGCKA